MSKQGSSRKPLIIGIIAAVVILAALLGVLLTQCTGGESAATSEPVQTTTSDEVPSYELYWNLDRAEYDGKSEAGMSSRNPEEDGYFHVRFFYEGEIVELKVADRKTINAIEVNDLMGLEFDEDGIVVGVVSIDDLPLEQVGWQFYVQSVGGKMLKLNSSKAFNGLEVLLDIHENTGIWDMTGLEGEVGMSITPIGGDRVIAIANLAGELTHVYVYERPEFMQTFEAECIHCKKTVEWKMWTKESTLPSTTGHYQLQNDISGMSKQQYVEEDQKVCLDLNGKIVDGKENARVYTMHYPGTQLAIMDTSEGQKGALRGHSTASDQGGVVWVRYGQFHLYSGTLDGSDMICKLNGAAIDIPKGAYFYMHGGKIIGGNAKAVKNDKGNWTNGVGGTIVVRGKFVMNDGVIQGGRATGAVTKYNADGTPNTYSRGYGGNIYVGTGGEFEMNGGTIKGGAATHSGGNIYVDGTGVFTMNGGVVTGGKVTGKGRNGGNVFVTAKSTFTMNGGSILNGVSYNCGANLYTNGKVVMNGGVIADGKLYNWGTTKLNATDNRANVFSVQGDFYMYGGRIAGGFTAVDTAVDKNPTIVLLSGYATIVADEGSKYDDLVLNTGGDGVTVYVGTLYDSARIGVNASTGIFTEPTKEANVDNFFSNVDDAEICYVDGRIALGRWGCLCGNNDKGNHYGECDGEQLFWGPLTSTTMPNSTGNYYLPRVANSKGVLEPRTINAKEQSSMVEGAQIKLDLNGGTIIAKKDYRFFSLHNPNTFLTITDSSEGKTGIVKSSGQGTTQGNVIWVRYGRFDFYGGTLDGSAYTLHQAWNTGDGKEKDDKLFGTDDDALSGRDGGTISMSTGTTFNMYGGTVIGNQMPNIMLTKTNKITSVGEDGEEIVTETTATKEINAANGASLLIGKNCTFNMYAGTIRDGFTEQVAGNIYIYGGGTANLYGGTISGGRAGSSFATNVTTKIVSNGWGGNIDTKSGSFLNILGEDVLITDGKAGGNGGNIRSAGTITMKAGTISNGQSTKDQGGNLFNSGAATLTGGLITGGKAANGGNVAVNSGKDTLLDGIVIENGTATGYGGNLRLSTTNTKGKLVIAGETVIRDGKAANGGNLAFATNDLNKNDPIATVEINGGTISGGVAKDGSGGAINASGTTYITMNGGTIENNAAKLGGSVYLNAIKDFTMNGGLIDGGSTLAADHGGTGSGNGGNFKVDNNAPITMNGGTISNGKTGDFGGNIWTQGSFTMNGGTVSGGEAKAATNKAGGNLFTNNGNGKFYLNGGTVEGGDAANGGNIALKHANAICVVDGATITGGSTSSGHGGNVNVEKGTFTLKSGSVINGVSKNTAGNIYGNGGKVIIEGGKISGGTDKNGATSVQRNIYIVGAAIELRGGEIEGAVGVINYNSNSASVKMSGAPVIKSETTGLTLSYGNDTGKTGATMIPAIQIDAPMTDGAEVYINCTKAEVGKFTTATQEAYAEYFHSDDDIREVAYYDGCLALGKVQCICGATDGKHKSYTDPDGNFVGCDGTDVFFLAWTSTSSLPTTTGNYYLTADVNYSGQGSIAKNANVVLDLNGKTVKPAIDKNTGKDVNARVYSLHNQNTRLTITDTVGNGKIVGSSVRVDQGNVIWVRKTADWAASEVGTFVLMGGTLVGANANNTNVGELIDVDDYGTVYMLGGTLTGGHAKNGGNVNLAANSKFYMVGGTITGGQATSGGNVNLAAKSTFYMVGGTIEDGFTTSGHGGNFASQGTLIVEGGTIQNGAAHASTGNAGNIYANAGSVIVKGGEILGGTDKNGANGEYSNIYIVSAALELRGGEIDGGVDIINYNNDNGSVKISGSPVVKSSSRTGLSLAKGGTATHIPYVQIDEPMTEGAEVYINTSATNGGKFTTATEEAYVKYFHSNDPDRTVGYAVDSIGLGRYSCLCGSTTETHKPGCTEETLFWIPWSSTTSLPTTTGNYYINPDVTITVGTHQTISTDAKINLDLNGRTVKTNDGAAYRVYKLDAVNAELSVSDTVGTGKIVSTATYDQGCVFWFTQEYTKVNAIDIEIDASGLTSRGTAAMGGNAICMEKAYSEFNMYGGKLLGGKTAYGGGAIYGSNWASVVRLSDGAEVIGHAEETYPAIRLAGTKNVISDATVTGGVELTSFRFDKDSTTSTSQLTLNAGANVDRIVLSDINDGRTSSGSYFILPLITVNGKLADGVEIEVTTQNDTPHVYSANAVDAENEDNFCSGSNELYCFRNTDGKLELILDNDPTFHCVCGSTGKHQQGCDGKRVRWIEWTDELAKAQNGTSATAANSLPKKVNGYYYLSKNVEITGQQKIDVANAEIYLDLNGHTVKNSGTSGMRLYWIAGDTAKLTITDCSAAKTGKLYNNSAYSQGMCVWVNANKAVFNLFNATVDATDATGSGDNEARASAINVSSTWATFNMYSGIINGSDAPNGGGAIFGHSSSSATNIFGGTVNAHQDETDCGIFTYGAAYLNGGTINGGLEFNDNSDGTKSGIWMSGSPKIDYIKITDEAVDGTPDTNLRLLPITITSNLELEKPIDLYCEVNGITSGVIAKPGTDVTLDESAPEWFSGKTHAIVLKDGKLELVGGENVYCVCGSTTNEHSEGCDGTHYIWTALPTSYKGGKLATGNYYLTAPVNLTTNQISFAANSVVRINLNGYTITRNDYRAITLDGSTGTELTITDTYVVPEDNTDTTRAGGTIKLAETDSQPYTGQGMGVWVTANSTVNWIKGTLDATDAHTTNKTGGTAFCVESGSTLNIYGGTIQGGRLSMAANNDVNGATIYANGKVYIGKATICGGRTDGGKGGAIYVQSSGNVELNGGTIQGGEAFTAKYGETSHYGNGGAVFVNKGTFTLTSGTIKNGFTGGQGGNVYIDGAEGKLIVNGGSIESGRANSNGGNVYVRYGSITMTAGTIKNGYKGESDYWNTFANIGFDDAAASMTMTGGTVDGNIACVSSRGAVMTISGDAKITKTYNDLSAHTMTIKIGDLTDNAEIYLHHKNDVSYSILAADNYTLTEQDLSRIEPGQTYYNLTLDTANNKIDVTPAT